MSKNEQKYKNVGRNKAIALLIAALVFLTTFPLWADKFLIGAMILIFIYLACSEMWSFMAEHAGMVSIGQQTFIGLGGYGLAIFAMLQGLPIWASIIITAVLGAIVAAALSVPLLRLRGIYFTIGSWIAAEIFLLFFNSWEYVGAGKGLIFRPAFALSTTEIYYAALAVALISIFTFYYMYHSKLGYGLRAIGSDEDVAAEVGINTFKCKALCFIIAGLITTLAGSVNLLNHAYLRAPAAFSIMWSVNFIFISIIGGIGRITGPIIGSIIFVALGYILAGYIGLSLLIQAIVAILMLIFLPKGVWGIIAEKLRIKHPI